MAGVRGGCAVSGLVERDAGRRGGGPGCKGVPMDAFSVEGQFWLPDAPGRTVPGTLSLAGSLALALDGSLAAYAPPPDGEPRRRGRRMQRPVVHGLLRDGREATLLDVEGTDASGPYGRASETHAVGAAVVGALVERDLFVGASCRFDSLQAWTHPDPMLQEQGGRDDQVAVSTARKVLTEARHGALTVRLIVGAEGTSGSARVWLDQVCVFELEGPPAALSVVVDDWVRPVQDFLVVALGSPARLTSLRVAVPDAEPRDGRPEAFFAATQPPEGSAPTVAGVRSYYSPALHRREDPVPPLSELLPAWFEIRDRLGDAVSLAAAPFHAPFMYAEHRYATAFQAAEALATRLHGGPEKARADHGARVQDATQALARSGLPEDTVRWATRVLQGANNKSLPQLIGELLDGVGAVGPDILSAAPEFGRYAAKLRAGVSHGGADRTDAARRHWHGQALLWAVRVRLLHEAGVPLAVLTDRARGTPAFKQMLAGLADPGQER